MKTRCAKCDRPTRIPFKERPPCVCGSVCWYRGPRPEWPPIGAAAFLYGLSIPEMHWAPREPSPNALAARGERNTAHRLTWSVVRRMRKCLRSGWRQREVAHAFKVSEEWVSKINRNVGWRERGDD